MSQTDITGNQPHARQTETIEIQKLSIRDEQDEEEDKKSQDLNQSQQPKAQGVTQEISNLGSSSRSVNSPEPGLKKQIGIYQRAQKHDSDAEEDADVVCSYVSASVDETMRYIDEQLKDLRNMIHPNEWNNIPACVRSAIMGLIDFNDAIT